MLKTTGIRGKGQAKFVWSKIEYKSDPLGAETLQYLSELAQVRARMFDGKTRTATQIQNLESRQMMIMDILGGFHGVQIRLSAERQVA
jgi:hypothetical protein